ncbi:MAG: calcium-translocating P-type ATPase, PMCA-type [Erysipelotrichaceae bacterium]
MTYRNSIYAVLKKYKVDENIGLSDNEVEKRLKQYGLNELKKDKKISLIEMFIQQFKDPMVLILLVGAIVSIFLKEYVDSIIIFSVITLNAFIGVIQESKAEKAIEALKALSSPHAFVIRNACLIEIASSELVLGDIVELKTGCYIPADLRLLSTVNLKVDESTLTGESEAVEKDADIIYSNEELIGDQRNMAFMSTFVTYGKGRGIVVSTGMNSEVGKIACMLEEKNEDMTPLQKRLASLSKQLGFISVVICTLMFIIALFQGRNLFDMLILSISLAVAAIPEGLPAVVTIVLAIGVQEMSANHAIVRKLHAVETLGSVSIICSDKTGTLTQNKMHVETIYAKDEFNFEPDDIFYHALILCNDVYIQGDEIIGEPMEKALAHFAINKGFNKQTLECNYPRVNEIPFDSNRKLMSTVHKMKKDYRIYTKGAWEKILDISTSLYKDGQCIALNEYERAKIIEAGRIMSTNALRIIAVGYRNIKNPLSSELEQGLTFLGLVGLIDPPRENVKESIESCHNAGISVAMITGDHPLTALAIARQLNIARSENEVISGSELDEMDDQSLNQCIKNKHVFARVTPLHKVRIVKAFKSNGYVVAMSGDGVNDAPSLKQADIGIAMGKDGTDVCKQASDMILCDDDFSTIVRAIEAGRNIYLNIQKAVLYLLSCNLGEITALFLAIVCLPDVVSTLCAVQILWVNLITDALPALALGVDPKDCFIMREKPRDRKESLFAHGGIMFTILNGMLIGTITLVAFRYGLNISNRNAQTMAFMVLSISQLFHALNLTSRTHSIFTVGIFKNKWLILTIIFGVILQVMVCNLPFFQALLKTERLDMIAWLIIFGLSLLPIVINEISKWIAKEH